MRRTNLPHPHREVDADGPDVDRVGRRKVAALPALVLVLPIHLQAPDRAAQPCTLPETRKRAARHERGGASERKGGTVGPAAPLPEVQLPQWRTLPQSMWTKFDPEYLPTPPALQAEAARKSWFTEREPRRRSAAWPLR